MVTRISTAWIVLSWGVLYGKRGAPSRCSASSPVPAAAVIYFLVQCMAPLVAIATTALLPAGSGLLLHSIRPRASSEPDDAAGEPAGTEGSGRSAATRSSIESAEPTKTRRFAPRVILPLAAVFLYALCGEVLRGFATASGNQASLDVMGNLYLLGSAIGLVVMGVILALIPGFTRKRPADARHPHHAAHRCRLPGHHAEHLVLLRLRRVRSRLQCYRSLRGCTARILRNAPGRGVQRVRRHVMLLGVRVVLGAPIASSLGQIVSWPCAMDRHPRSPCSS
ncbi:MAG: hypothetical protein ACLSVD_12660 [Eggerthellaceae bacterium]